MAMSQIAKLTQELFNIRQQKRKLEETEKSVLSELKEKVDPLMDEYDKVSGETRMGIGNLILSRTSGVHRSISAEKLLERGVAPDIVAYATKTTTYRQYRVSEAETDERA